jgi:hypothetical protein
VQKTSKFELDVWSYSRRAWASAHGMHSLDQFHADCLRVAKEARAEGLPWADALDA